MSETLLRLVALCVGCAVMGLYLRSDAPHMARLLSLAAALAVFGVCISELRPLFSFLRELTEQSNFSPYASVLIKACGLGMIAHFAAEFCRDAGEQSLASKAELAGKCAILLCSLPILSLLFQQIKELLQ